MSLARSPAPGEVFARRVFFWAGIYGLIVSLPQYFNEARMGQDYPPAITHPEYYYGFIGLVVSWQVVFLLISRDPARFRPLMPVAALLEKFPWFVLALLLWLQHKVPTILLVFGSIDGLLGCLFLLAYARLKPALSAP